jgi:predicted enzyme related to lactoylglutathione lyase
MPGLTRQAQMQYGEKVKATRLFLTMLGVVTLAACAGIEPNLPSVTESPTNNRSPGKVVWRDLITSVPAESRRFYEELFGWEFEAVGSMLGLGGNDAYHLIRHNGRMIGGMIDANRLQNDNDISQWVTIISVPDIDEAVRKVESLGGTTFTPPTNLAQRGQIAVVADAQGAIHALLQTRDGDPADHEPDINDFLWDELWTTDVAGATQFYSSVMGYTYTDENVDYDDREEDYRVLRQGDTPRAGLMLNPFEGVQPVWVNYIRVEDPAAITARVESLGGRILVDAQPRDIGGTVAFVAGPSGAGIAVQTWPLTEQ